MRVIISAGGTGGHIYPALAIIEKIKEKEPFSEFLYIGTHNRMEKDIVPNRGIPFTSVEMYGFSKNIFKNFKTLNCLIKAYKKCKKIMQDFKPDIVIGVGGYITVPTVLAASNLKIKTFIHEQNSIPGKSNEYLAKKVDMVGVSFKSSLKYFKNNVVFTGNPCSENAMKVQAANKNNYNLSENKKLVLFVMGSLGSQKMNEILVNTMGKFDNKSYEIIYVTGKNYYENVKNVSFPNNVHVLPYIENMTSLMKKTDIMVSRAGASTISEIIALQVPSILIPSPWVANNHQYYNALDMIENNACLLVEEKNLEGDTLVNTIDEVINDSNKISNIKENLKKLSVDNSATIIYEKLREIIDRK